MDGLTATKEIRSIKRDDAAQIPIIAMTANAFEEDAKEMFCSRDECTLSETISD